VDPAREVPEVRRCEGVPHAEPGQRGPGVVRGGGHGGGMVEGRVGGGERRTRIGSRGLGHQLRHGIGEPAVRDQRAG
jgi:hypothetical protein